MNNPVNDAWKPSISPQTVRYLILKAKEFDVKDVVTEPDPAQIRATMG